MDGNNFFGQLRGYIDQLEKSTKAMESQLPAILKGNIAPEQRNSLADEYNDVLEQEFVKDKKGQSFAKAQFEAAQKYLIMMFMDTPEGRKLAEERAEAFKEYKDEKMKGFLESRKKGDKGNADVQE